MIINISLYEIINKDEMVKKLLEKGLSLHGNTIQLELPSYIREVFGIEDLSDKNTTKISYYYYNEENEKGIVWDKFWGEWFEKETIGTKKTANPYGCILIEIDNRCYAISLGGSYHIVSNYCDEAFGYEIGGRIFKKDSVEGKYSKYFNNKKSRTITQYYSDVSVMMDVGESHELLTAKVKLSDEFINFKLYEYNKLITFNESIKFKSSDFSPTEIINIIQEMHYIRSFKKEGFDFPRVKSVLNTEQNADLLNKLDKVLLDLILNDEYMNKLSLTNYVKFGTDLKDIATLTGKMEMIYDSKKEFINDMDIFDIVEVLQSRNCRDLNKVKIRIEELDNADVELKRLLDYQTELDGKLYMLIDGKWCFYNDAFVQYIDREINNVNECAVLNESLNIDDDILEKGRSINNKHNRNVDYKEYNYNKYLSKYKNFKLLDRDNSYQNIKKIEYADLYSEGHLIHVKIGDVKDWRYCISQSKNSIEALKDDKLAIKKHVNGDISCISLLLVTQNKNLFIEGGVDLSRCRSLNFKIEIITWYKEVKESDLIPKIIFAFDESSVKKKSI